VHYARSLSLQLGSRPAWIITAVAIVVPLCTLSLSSYAFQAGYPRIAGITTTPDAARTAQAVKLSTTVSFDGTGGRQCTVKTHVLYLENGKWSNKMTEIHDFVVSADKPQEVIDWFTPTLAGNYKYTSTLSQSLHIIETQEAAFSAQ